MIEELPVTPRITQDGSYTLYSARVDQCYHSARGALTESAYVFAQRGLESFVGKREVHLLEVGFGTGLNLLATLLWCQQHDMECYYTGVELYPPSPDLLFSLPSPAGLNSPCLAMWRMALRAPWGECVELRDENLEIRGLISKRPPRLMLTKLEEDIRTVDLPHDRYDAIFHDAFSVEAQPELWSPELFTKLNRTLHQKGCLVTYSASGIVKRALRQAGFRVERLPGALGKHHMLRAWRETTT